MKTPHEDSSESFEDEAPTETPFDPKQGIWFKYGRIYVDRANQIAEFERRLDVRLPSDFLDLIGNYCGGGFDGWYRVNKSERGSLVWTHLLLMKLPDAVDEESENHSFMKGRTFITTKLLDTKKAIFGTESGGLRYFPFGTATLFRSQSDGTDGYLVFDRMNEDEVVFLPDENGQSFRIAGSFSEMMHGAVFEFFG